VRVYQMQLARPGAIDSDKLITDTHCTYKPEHCLEGSDVYENACFPIVGASYVRVPGASVGAVAQPVGRRGLLLCGSSGVCAYQQMHKGVDADWASQLCRQHMIF